MAFEDEYSILYPETVHVPAYTHCLDMGEEKKLRTTSFIAV